MDDNIKDGGNYSELRAYLDGSDEAKATANNLSRILRDELSYDGELFHMLDVGCSDGELSFSLLHGLIEMFPNFRLLGLEPELEAYNRFVGRATGKDFLEARNQTVQKFLEETEQTKPEVFDYIAFIQSWYHFPREDWHFILSGSYSLLKGNGLMIIALDSHDGEIYRLKDLIAVEKPDTIEYGDLFSVEEIEKFLDSEGVNYETVSFPIYINIKDGEDKIQRFARHLAFLYRTFPEKILANYKAEISDLLESNRRGKEYFIENLVKSIVIKKTQRT